MKEDGRQSDLRKRTLDFALIILRLTSKIPNSIEGSAIRKQLVRSGTSPGAHYREAYRARSNAEFISKMEGGLQELDETAYWVELLTYSKLLAAKETTTVIAETEELTRIFVACVQTAKKRMAK